MPLTREETFRTVEVNGVPVGYHEAGDGPVIVCIHGGAPGADGWHNFGQNLEALSAHHRVLILDLPGYGGSGEIDLAEGRFTSYARHFGDLFSVLGIDRATLIGLATGGAVAIIMAADHPELVEKLVLVSSAGGLPTFSVMPSEGQKAIRSYYRGEGPSRERMREYLKLSLYDEGLITDELVESRYQASIGRQGETKPGQPTRPEVIWQRLPEIACPTLVMWGRDNRVQGYDNALFMLNQIPDVEVHLFGRAGLWLPFERARRFEALVRDFLAD